MSCSLEEMIYSGETQKYYIPIYNIKPCVIILLYYGRLPYLLLSMDGDCEDLDDDFSDFVDEFADGCW